MRISTRLLKMAVVLSSVLLVGGFVCYRAGAFNGLTGSSPPAAAASAELPPETPDTNQTVFLIDGTSKSGAIFRGPIPAQQAQHAAPPPARTVMSGSKSVAPLLGGGESQPAPQAPGPPPTPPSK